MSKWDTEETEEIGQNPGHQNSANRSLFDKFLNMFGFEAEIVEEEEAADPEPEVYQIQDAYERNVAAWEAENDDEELWDGHGMQTMF